MEGSKNILVAEDDKAYGNTYKTKLQSEGYNVKIVQQGDLVLPELKKNKPDLLILDLIMPGKNGFDILEELRADEYLKDLKVIVASNLSQDEDIEKVKKIGVLDFLVKSDVSISEFVTKVKRILGD